MSAQKDILTKELIEIFNKNIDKIKKYYGHDNELDLWHTILKISFIEINHEASVFDWKRYLQFRDLKKANLKTPYHACWHYLNYGRKERRKCYKLNSEEPYTFDFNWKLYLYLNRDIFNNIIKIICYIL